MDKEDFFFFLVLNPNPSVKKDKMLGKMNFITEEREHDDYYRAYINNMRWGKKLLKELIFQANLEANILNDKLKLDKKRGLLDWM